MYTAEICRDPIVFLNLRGHWDLLLKQTYTNSPFLSWEWLFSWWKHFGKAKDLFIILIWNEFHDLVGIAPLFIHKTKYYYFPVREITFIGVGHSDRQDFLIKDNDVQVLGTILSQIFLHKNEWDIIKLDQIPQGSILFEQVSDDHRNVLIETSSACPFVRIQGTWEDYYNSLSYKFRRDLKNRTNKLNRAGKWELLIKTTSMHLRKELEKAVTIESKSRKIESQKSFLSKTENFRFILEFFDFCAEKEWIDFSELILNSVCIAYLIGFKYNNNYYAYNMAFDENFMDMSPGKILFQEKIKWCFHNYPQIQEFDLLRGDSYLKSKWTNDSRQHYRIIIFNKRFGIQILRFLVVNIKPVVKKILRLLSKSNHFSE